MCVCVCMLVWGHGPNMIIEFVEFVTDSIADPLGWESFTVALIAVFCIEVVSGTNGALCAIDKLYDDGVRYAAVVAVVVAAVACVVVAAAVVDGAVGGVVVVVAVVDDVYVADVVCVVVGGVVVVVVVVVAVVVVVVVDVCGVVVAVVVVVGGGGGGGVVAAVVGRVVFDLADARHWRLHVMQCTSSGHGKGHFCIRTHLVLSMLLRQYPACRARIPSPGVNGIPGGVFGTSNG